MLLLFLLGLVLTLVILYLYKSIYKPLQIWKESNVPYLTPWPVFGEMGSFVFGRKAIGDIVYDLYNAKKTKNTRFFGFFNFTKPTYLIKDIELIKQIGIKEFDNFVDHSQFTDEENDPLFGKNLFSLKGYRWKQMRSTLSPAFTGRKMRAMFTLISDCAVQFVNHFAKVVDPNKPLELEMKDTFSRFTNDAIASSAFGIQCNSLAEEDNQFYRMSRKAIDFSGIKAIYFLGAKFSAKLINFLGIEMFDRDGGNFFRDIIVNNIKTRETQGIIRHDMIHLLMEARKGKLKHEEVVSTKEDSAGFATAEESEVGKDAMMAKLDLSDDDVTAQALIFIAGGFDTTSTTFCYMAHELALNPNVQGKLQQEIDETWNKCNGKLTYDILVKMKYMDMVVSETLRKWPAGIFVDRICNGTFTIEANNPGEPEITLSKGDIVWFPIFGIQRDPKYFPNPDKFDPERFSEENKGNIDPYSYLPFGIGPRNCIGSRFALLEAKIIFFYLLSKFTIEVSKKTQINLRYKKYDFGTLAEKGFWLALKRRNNE